MVLSFNNFSILQFPTQTINLLKLLLIPALTGNYHFLIHLFPSQLADTPAPFPLTYADSRTTQSCQTPIPSTHSSAPTLIANTI